MQAVLINHPKTDFEWKRWAWHHRKSHDAIRSAIAAKYGVTLNDYVIEPINSGPDFLQSNNQLHTDFNSILGLQSQDLQDTDLNDDRQAQSWVYTHWLQHRDAETALGIAS